MEHNHDHGEMRSGEMCKCGHHRIKPLVIALIGLTFLLHNAWGVFAPETVQVIWPTLLLALGFSKMVKCKCCR